MQIGVATRARRGPVSDQAVLACIPNPREISELVIRSDRREGAGEHAVITVRLDEQGHHRGDRPEREPREDEQVPAIAAAWDGCDPQRRGSLLRPTQTYGSRGIGPRKPRSSSAAAT